MSRAVVFFADGMEECEALITVDLLRRARIDVVTASVSDKTEVISSHSIRMFADCLASELDYSDADIVILPGGLRGTEKLAGSSAVAEQCRSFAADKKVAAICAAPTVLAGLGLLDGKNVTMYPGFSSQLSNINDTQSPVTVDGNIITGKAMGATVPFALEIIRQLEGNEAAEKVKSTICWPY